jgi:hypothetical protein
MSNKPVSAKAHGIIDYVFSGIQLFVPQLLGLNTSLAKTYSAAGAGFFVVNAITDTPASLKPGLSFKQHQNADTAFLIGYAALTLMPFVRKQKSALIFHLGLLLLGAVHYALTDYDAKDQS